MLLRGLGKCRLHVLKGGGTEIALVESLAEILVGAPVRVCLNLRWEVPNLSDVVSALLNFAFGLPEIPRHHIPLRLEDAITGIVDPLLTRLISRYGH